MIPPLHCDYLFNGRFSPNSGEQCALRECIHVETGNGIYIFEFLQDGNRQAGSVDMNQVFDDIATQLKPCGDRIREEITRGAYQRNRLAVIKINLIVALTQRIAVFIYPRVIPENIL